MDPADAAYALRELIKPKYAIPMHYGPNPFNKGTPAATDRGVAALPRKSCLKPGSRPISE